ncbi:MAG: gamma-glutamyltransferase family protein, partial [Candidatus Brockarchaeota archaeon]|nr:gamma-glutamyltransferase family protein [Candidatus Brockarchaeota archaeon]
MPNVDDFTTRPVVMGKNYAITSGHYLATLAGTSVVEKGGNAIDASACMAFCLAVLEPHLNSMGGEVPILLYSKKEERVVAVSGQGYAPKAATVEKFEELGIDLIPGDGLLAATVPSVVGTWIKVLEEYGKLRFSDILKPAISLAEEGFPAYAGLTSVLESNAGRFLNEWRSTAKVFLPNGKVPEEGQLVRQSDLAKVLRALSEADKSASSRSDGLCKARDLFYEGWIADRIVDFARNNEFMDASGKRNRGLIDSDDLAEYEARFEEPLSVDWIDVDVYKCPTWTQGPVFLQMLRILENFDLKSLGHNTADYVHLLVETVKLAFSDRERYYGDPDFDDVPIRRLLSKEYGKQRGELIDMSKASSEPAFGAASIGGAANDGDTTHLDAADKEGNVVSATQSGGWIQSSPIVDGLGFPLGTRMQMFYLDKKRNNCLRPRKRPRTTLTPSIATRGKRPYLAFGTPGGDT